MSKILYRNHLRKLHRKKHNNCWCFFFFFISSFFAFINIVHSIPFHFYIYSKYSKCNWEKKRRNCRFCCTGIFSRFHRVLFGTLYFLFLGPSHFKYIRGRCCHSQYNSAIAHIEGEGVTGTYFCVLSALSVTMCNVYTLRCTLHSISQHEYVVRLRFICVGILSHSSFDMKSFKNNYLYLSFFFIVIISTWAYPSWPHDLSIFLKTYFDILLTDLN